MATATFGNGEFPPFVEMDDADPLDPPLMAPICCSLRNLLMCGSVVVVVIDVNLNSIAPNSALFAVAGPVGVVVWASGTTAAAAISGPSELHPRVGLTSASAY